MGHNSSNRLAVVQGDITEEKAGAIVNAANNSLLGGAGVDGAIHRAAGRQLLEECRGLGGCPTGEAKITRGYNLPATWVIHTVGPVWSGGSQGEADLLANCYQRCLALAKEYNLQTIAFPAISTGAYRFPMELATRIAVREVSNFLKADSSQGDSSIQRVTFVCFNHEADSAYTAAVRELVDG
ncbi:MAG: O-acetyl-ADP-ribose deacetylase [SAR202 cluster bacterium Io17-Chloro-G7]|nr:MAG: O-acetyl-ADP-ribose deacetylase [SAR202 cluster bacterium Io17-Chloro-G7]